MIQIQFSIQLKKIDRYEIYFYNDILIIFNISSL